MLKKIKEFVSDRDNAYITLVLSSYQNILAKTIHKFKGDFDNDDFEFSFYIFNHLVYNFFMNYYNLTEKEICYDEFVDLLEQKILTEDDWKTIDNFSSAFIFEDWKETDSQKFLGHTFTFEEQEDENLVIFKYCTAYEKLNIFNDADFNEVNSLVSHYTMKKLAFENYMMKYSVLKKFKKKKWTSEQLTEYWIKKFDKFARKVLKKRKVRKAINGNPRLYWYFYSSILLVLYCAWILMLHPSRSDELQEYFRCYQWRALAAYMMIS